MHNDARAHARADCAYEVTEHKPDVYAVCVPFGVTISIADRRPEHLAERVAQRASVAGSDNVSDCSA